MEWKHTKTVEIPRGARFPPRDGRDCSQCGRDFKGLEFGGAYMDTPVCIDCVECLTVVNNTVKGSTEDGDDKALKLKPAFTKEETKAVLEQAYKRATKWAEDNVDYMAKVTLLKPYFWAKKTYDLPDQDNE